MGAKAPFFLRFKSEVAFHNQLAEKKIFYILSRLSSNDYKPAGIECLVLPLTHNPTKPQYDFYLNHHLDQCH